MWCHSFHRLCENTGSRTAPSRAQLESHFSTVRLGFIFSYWAFLHFIRVVTMYLIGWTVADTAALRMLVVLFPSHGTNETLVIESWNYNQPWYLSLTWVQLLEDGDIDIKDVIHMYTVIMLKFQHGYRTPWSRVLLYKLVFAHLVKKFAYFYGTRNSL